MRLYIDICRLHFIYTFPVSVLAASLVTFSLKPQQVC